jgi:hypothetical protein
MAPCFGRDLVTVELTPIHAGAILDEVPKEGEGLKFAGSALVAYGSSREEVIEMLKKDVYAENDVWDFNKVSGYM